MPGGKWPPGSPVVGILGWAVGPRGPFGEAPVAFGDGPQPEGADVVEHGPCRTCLADRGGAKALVAEVFLGVGMSDQPLSGVDVSYGEVSDAADRHARKAVFDAAFGDPVHVGRVVVEVSNDVPEFVR